MPSERLLVVDDDPAILALCHRILEADGYTVVDAKRGEDALAQLEAESFDLLLTDIRLPGLNGLEVTRRLRDRGIELTVVTMTGYSNMEMAIQALSLGVDEFLVKPFTLDSLRLTVSRALDKSRLRREIMRLRTLVPLLKTSQDFATARTREQVYEHMFASAQLLLKTNQVAFIEISPDANMLTVASVRGDQLAPLCNQVFFAFQLEQAQDLLTAGVTVWNERETRRLPFDLPDVTWLVAAPFVVRNHPLVLFLGSVPLAPSASDQEALRLIAHQAASALENVDLVGEISRALVTAREAERLKSEFINIAGHELRTPLTVLIGYAVLVKSRVSGELEEYIAEVLNQAERLQHIADDMLKLHSFASGYADLRLERCEVEQVVRQVVNAYRPMALEREQSIEMELDEMTGTCTADRAMLDLMLGSLLSNAIKFSPRQTRVRVIARGDPSHITFEIQDEGKGISPEQGEHIFDPFYQASYSLTREKGGLGIGLTLTREMVNAHGGKIWFEPAETRGTSFFISLPRECCPDRHANSPANMQ